MTEQAVRKTNDIPDSAPEKFRTKIIEFRKRRMRSKPQPTAVPVVAAHADELTEAERIAAHRKVTKAKLDLL